MNLNFDNIMKKIFYFVALVTLSLLFVQCETKPEGGENGVHEGHEYVDLGLPSGLKWATCNIGAESPEQLGYFLSWGEVEPKDYYYWDTYKYSGDTDSSFTKYCFDSQYGLDGFVDNKLQLDLEDDAAHVNWGGKWRMPTAEEAKELYDCCKWTWTIEKGMPGYKVMGINGNSIFMPAAGSMGWNEHYDFKNEVTYWTSTLSQDEYYPNQAVFIRAKEHNIDPIDSWSRRCWGFSVRAVCP